jgi:hypothetical protein
LEPAILALADEATEELPNEKLAELYDRFVRAREQAIVAEIRRVCGIEVDQGRFGAPEAVEEMMRDDDVAPDVLDEESSLEDELVELTGS